MKTATYKRWLGVACLLLAAVLLCTIVLFLLGIFRPFAPSRAEYPVWGVDVSEYQGEIDWPVLAAQGMQFAFIKATEGSGYTDPTFAHNWEGAAAAGLVAGAYHFFSFDSPAAAQAENFIAAVKPRAGMLPPVVDIELYGVHKGRVPDIQTVRASLAELLVLLEAHYGQVPIVYATESSYRLYIADAFEENPIWIRNVYFRPHLPDRRMPTFWQYSDKGVLPGYTGSEEYIDQNVFCGSEIEWEQFLALAAGSKLSYYRKSDPLCY